MILTLANRKTRQPKEGERVSGGNAEVVSKGTQPPGEPELILSAVSTSLTKATSSESAAGTFSALTCKICGATLRPKSTYCKECQSHQGLYGQLQRWGGIAGAILAVGSLVVGAASLLVGAATLARTKFSSPAEVKIKAMRCTYDEVYLAIQNSGVRIAILAEVTVQASGFRKNLPWTNNMLWLSPVKLEPDSLIVQPRSEKFLRLKAVHRKVDGMNLEIVRAGFKDSEVCSYAIMAKSTTIDEDEITSATTTCDCNV